MSEKHVAHWVEREDVGKVTVVRLKTPKIADDDVVRSVFDLIVKLIDEMGRTLIVLNLAAVEFLPSLGMGKLVMLNRKVQVAQGRLALCQLVPTVQEGLQRTRLIDLFKVYTTEADAIQALSAD